MDQLARVEALVRESVELKQRTIEENGPTVVRVAEVIAGVLQKGNKVLFCGNGGSAADAQHLAAELLVRLRPEVNRRPLPALALAVDTSTLTACANDYGFDEHYGRMVNALGQPGDVLVALSTSGRSHNVNVALMAAQSLDIYTIGLLGSGGGEALWYCDHAIVVPSTVTGRIQETHITLGHAILELVEEMILDEAA